MELNRRTFVAALVAGALSGRSLLAAEHKKEEEKGEWEKLGERKVGKKEDHDTIEVKSDRGFTALSFRVEDANIEVDEIKIVFGNDETYEPKEKLVFKEGQTSGKIDLPGKTRAIKRIHFLYRTIGHGEATVVVYGKLGNEIKK